MKDDLWCEEFYDLTIPLKLGAKKYGKESWLKGNQFNHKDNCASINRHLAQFIVDPYSKDNESGTYHGVSAALRIMMEITLIKRDLPIR